MKAEHLKVFIGPLVAVTACTHLIPVHTHVKVGMPFATRSHFAESTFLKNMKNMKKFASYLSTSTYVGNPQHHVNSLGVFHSTASQQKHNLPDDIRSSVRLLHLDFVSCESSVAATIEKNVTKIES
jgi:hypothetical protein